MRIFATGDERRIAELKLKFGNEISSGELRKENISLLTNYDVIFDLNADERDQLTEMDSYLENKLVIVCAVKKSLKELTQGVKSTGKFDIAGMNLLPTFINRNQLEVSFSDQTSKKKFSDFAGEMKAEFLEVEDHVGMVTPRVVFLVINEACFSLQEGVATITDIDKAMKLGTNYPYGPFEWCDRIGVKDVYETLEAIANDTHDKRYEISELLKVKYLKRETFY